MTLRRLGRLEAAEEAAARRLAEAHAERRTLLLDRCNRMLLRNLKALRERRQGPTPSVRIGAAGQVNVAAQQVNGMPDRAETEL